MRLAAPKTKAPTAPVMRGVQGIPNLTARPSVGSASPRTGAKTATAPKPTKVVTKTTHYTPPPAPKAAAIQRRVAAAPAPRVAPKAASHPAATPKPPPVVVANKTGAITKPVPPPPVVPGPVEPIAPPPPELNAYLGTDAEYQGAMNDANLAGTNYQADMTRNQTTSDASFAQRLRDMMTQQTTDQGNLQEQMAGRGMLQSGVYSDALSGLNQQYTDAQTGLTSEQAGVNAGYQTDYGNFQSGQITTREEARQAAIARRAAQYGL